MIKKKNDEVAQVAQRHTLLKKLIFPTNFVLKFFL